MNHVIVIKEMKRELKVKNKKATGGQQTIYDAVNIIPLTPQKIVKFAIVANVPALAIGSQEFLDLLQFLKQDSCLVERHDF